MIKDDEFLEKIKEVANKNLISCKDLLYLSNMYKVKSLSAGELCDQNGFKIIDCSLGVFGKKLTQNILKSQDLEKIKESLNSRSRLDCAKAYKLSIDLNTSIENIGKSAETLNIKIDNCLLGCFKKGVECGSKSKGLDL